MEAYAFTGIQHRDVIAPFLSVHSCKAKRRFQSQTTWIWLLMTCLCCLRCYLCNFSLLWEISTLESVFKDAFSATAFTGQWRIQTFRWGAGGAGHLDPEIRGSSSPKKFFPALWASVWSKNKRGAAPPGPLPWIRHCRIHVDGEVRQAGEKNLPCQTKRIRIR